MCETISHDRYSEIVSLTMASTTSSSRHTAVLIST